jgi:cell division protein FtsN
MTRDYKTTSRPRSRRGNRGSGFFWFVSGAVVGAFAVALAWTLQETERAAPEAATAAAEEKGPKARPRFDFHNILPEMEVVVPDEELSAKPPPAPPKPRPEPTPAAEPAKPMEEKTAAAEDRASQGGSYLLQVASFRAVADAERLKARLALLGIQTQIQKVTINGKDTYHRVRTGTYKDKASANEARALLARNGLESITIKLK